MKASFAAYTLTRMGGPAPDDVGPALLRVIEQHHARFGYSPAVTVALNPANAAKALEIQNVQVIVKPGVMVWEAWVLIEESKPKSRLQRISQAQRDLTPERARELLRGQQLALF
jgi:hypothetical protein